MQRPRGRWICIMFRELQRKLLLEHSMEERLRSVMKRQYVDFHFLFFYAVFLFVYLSVETSGSRYCSWSAKISWISSKKFSPKQGTEEILHF